MRLRPVLFLLLSLLAAATVPQRAAQAQSGAPSISCSINASPTHLTAQFTTGYCLAREPSTSYSIAVRVQAESGHAYSYQWQTPSGLSPTAHCQSTTNDCVLGAGGNAAGKSGSVNVLVTDLTTGSQTPLSAAFDIEPVCSGCPATAPTFGVAGDGTVIVYPPPSCGGSQIVWC